MTLSKGINRQLEIIANTKDITKGSIYNQKKKCGHKNYKCATGQLHQTIYEDNFRADGWIPILDFVHAIEHAYDAANLATETTDQCWVKYIKFATYIWQGKALTVIRRLDKNIVVNE